MCGDPRLSHLDLRSKLFSISLGTHALLLYSVGNKRRSLSMSQRAHQAGAFPGFDNMKELGVFLLPPGWVPVHCRVTTSIKFACAHLYTWVKKGTTGVSGQRTQHNVPAQALNPDCDPEMSALTLAAAVLLLLHIILISFHLSLSL